MAEVPVVREIDVYLTKTLLENLMLLQYPSKPSERSYDGKEILCAKTKPRQKKVELQIAVNPRTRNYDRSKGEQIALNTDGSNVVYGSDDTYFNSSLVDKQVWTSQKAYLSSGCYVVARLHDGGLHLNPIPVVLQMYPTYNYLDKGYTLGLIEAGIEEEKKEEVKAVTVKFAAPNSEKARKAREKSFSYLKEKSEAEPWIFAEYHQIGSQHSKLEFQKLVCPDLQNDMSNRPISSKGHIHTLIAEGLLQGEPLKNESSSASSSVSSALTDRLRTLMLSAHVLRFDTILEMLPQELASNVEKVLQQIAILVQGCWVVKSDIVYQKESASPISGIGAEIMIRARDYILWSFTKLKFMTRADIIAVIPLPFEDVTLMLSQIAKRIPSKGWEFKFSYDQEFVDNHPNIVQRQDMLWDVRYKQLARDLRLGQMAVPDSLPRKSFPPPPSPKERKHFKYREPVSGDDTEESGAESSSSEKMDVEFNKKGRPFRRISGGKKRTTLSPVKTGSRSRHLSASAYDMPCTFLSALPSLEIKSELLSHVKDIMYERFCLTLNELRDSLSEASLGYLAQRDDCDSLLEEVLIELGSQKLMNKWPQNTPPATLYAFTKFGTTLDRYREALLDLFTNTARSRPNFLIKKIEDENGEIVSESMCKQIFEEYCLYKAGYYYLKGTITADS